jgi:uncharacterized protein
MDTEGYANDKKNLLMKCLAGSRLYGTSKETSDYDWRGVCYAPVETLLGMTAFQQYERHGEEDTTIWTLNRFFSLCTDNNPNMMDILCAPPEKWAFWKPEWMRVYAQRRLFLSQNIRFRFCGYAFSQLDRINRHYRWLTNPPEKAPTLEEFGGFLESSEKGGQKKVFKTKENEDAYAKAAKHWAEYQTWLKERNPARAELEKKYGYDTKHGSHLVRLMLQAETILRTGDYDPVLQGANKEMVLSVLHGGWKYEKLIVWAAETEKYVMEMPTCLPHDPNRKAIEELLIELNFNRIKETK